MAEDLPPVVQKAIAENKSNCKTVALEKGFITRKDINGDGRPDFVLDYESFTCDGNWRWFLCEPDVRRRFSPPFQMVPTPRSSTGFSRASICEVQGRPAIVVGLPGFACGKDPTEICEVVKSWNGSVFVDMPAARTGGTAGIKNGKSIGPIRAVLAEVLAMYGRGQMGPFASDAVMRKHFTARFTSLWDRAMARNDGTIDADPFTDQGNSVNLQGVDIVAETPNAATVEIHLSWDESEQQHL